MTDTPATNRRLGWVVGLTSTAYFMVVLDSVVVITALPRMQRDLHVSLSSLQWTLNAYGIAFAAGIITAAALGDRFGRRKVFTIGLALFTVASVACALAPNLSELIAARTVQGLGGAVVLPLSLTILTAAFPIERRGMIVGIYGGLAGLAVAMGPIVGGAVTQGIDWHWIFWINVPIGVVAVLLGLRLLPESYGAPERLDLVGVGLVTAGVVALVWALTRAKRRRLGERRDRRHARRRDGAARRLRRGGSTRVAEPMVPLRLFAVRDFAIGNVTTFLMSGAIFAGGLLVTEEFQLARHYSPVGAGVRLLPFFATPMFVSPVAGALSDRIGRRPIIVVGLSLLTAGFVWVAWRGSLAHELGRARDRASRRRRRDLDGPPDGADRRPERCRPGRDGEGVRDQLHGAALRRGLRGRDRQHRVRKLRRPRKPGRRDGRIQAGALGLLRLCRAWGARRRGDVGTAENRRRGRAGGPANRRLNPTTPKNYSVQKGDTQCRTSCTASRSTRRRSACTNSQRPGKESSDGGRAARSPATTTSAAGSRSTSATRRTPAATFEVIERSPAQIAWRCVDGPPDWIDTRITYAIKPRGDGGTTLLFSHEGWRQENEFMNGCSTNWAAYLMSLKSGAEDHGFNAYPGGEFSRWD